MGDLLKRNMGFYETDLSWTWTNKKLPLANSDSFKENLE
jgi:hypothetical protein